MIRQKYQLTATSGRYQKIQTQASVRNLEKISYFEMEFYRVNKIKIDNK